MATRRTILAGLAVGLSGVGGFVAYDQLAPEDATRVENGGSTALSESAETLASGSFTGKAGHECSGQVALVQDGNTHYLRFVEYKQTQGPDVYMYVCPDPDPDTQSEISAGTKVRIDGGAEDGESTKTGTFVQQLPSAVDVGTIRGIGVWCDNFQTPFGAATLQ